MEEINLVKVYIKIVFKYFIVYRIKDFDRLFKISNKK